MLYTSTRGGGKKEPFSHVLMKGLASDGGLFVPETLPDFSNDIQSWKDLSYQELAVKIMYPFVEGSISETDFTSAINDAYATFTSDDITPLTPIGENEYLLELYHGPTLAFKDVALQLLGRLMDLFLNKNKEHITLLGSTSGDTGSAIIHGCRARAGMDIVIMHPLNRVSPVQRKQMTSVLDANIHNIALRGTFDDCQSMQKALFADEQMQTLCLSSGNSINWGRVLPQVVYYFKSYLALGADKPCSYVVPTGNFGDIYAGFLAKSMGLPINKLVIATNDNDILHRFGETGTYKTTSLIHTITPSMDILVASNFERLLYALYNNDSEKVAAHMQELTKDGAFTVDAPQLEAYRKIFISGACSEENTRKVIKNIYDETARLIDPHTAVGVFVGREKELQNEDAPVVYLSTAHPSKFTEPVKEATGQTPQLPDSLADLLDRPERVVEIDNDIDAVRAFIMNAVSKTD